MTLNHQTNNKQLTVSLDIFELHGIFATFFPADMTWWVCRSTPRPKALIEGHLEEQMTAAIPG